MDISNEEIAEMFADPVYCLPRVVGWNIKGGKAMVSESMWIKAAMVSNNQDGAEKWLKRLLKNLKK